MTEVEERPVFEILIDKTFHYLKSPHNPKKKSKTKIG